MASPVGIAFVAVAIGALLLLDDVIEGDSPGVIDVGLAAVVAALASLALLLLLRAGRARTRARERARHNVEVLNAVQALQDDANRPGVLDSLVEHVCEAVGGDLAAVIALDAEDPDHIRAMATYNAPEDFETSRWPANHGLAGHVIGTGEPARIADYRAIANPLPTPERFVPRGAMAAPMEWDGMVRAALVVVSSDGERGFSEDELEVLCHMAALGSLAVEHAEMRAQLQHTLRVGAHALIAAVNVRDEYTAEHSEEVVALARAVGERLGLDARHRSRLEAAARLHDVGKLAIPDSILSKPGPLDDEEWEVMRRHPDVGADLLGRVPGMEELAPIVRAEHERWDGKGYPRGLVGVAIPIEARIVFACDAFHAMTSDRPYRSALPLEVAMAELRENAGSQFDPDVVDALLELVAQSPVATRAPG